jgi:uncharacterized protein (TIGR00255 family)
MTGYGKAEVTLPTKKIIIELKSLNSKNTDINMKVPFTYRDKELEIRQFIAEKLIRGKIDLNLSFDINESTSNLSINKSMVKNYYADLKLIADELGIDVGENLFQAILRLPEVFKSSQQEADEGEWDSIFAGISNAFTRLDEFRIQEGEALHEELKLRIANISQYLLNLSDFEKPRIDRIKERLSNSLKELGIQDEIDRNRFEQELIFYLEKLDITEEKTRLNNHCRYFIESMEGDDSSGKKLSFISQEIGREINTIGSKANDSDMQQIVIKMKDELEKIKEQCLNIL